MSFAFSEIIKYPIVLPFKVTFFTVVNASFLHKRKMLKNNLTDWENLFQSNNGNTELAGINLSRRGETLTVEDFAILSNYIYSLND